MVKDECSKPLLPPTRLSSHGRTGGSRKVYPFEILSSIFVIRYSIFSFLSPLRPPLHLPLRGGGNYRLSTRRRELTSVLIQQKSRGHILPAHGLYKTEKQDQPMSRLVPQKQVLGPCHD